MFCACARSSSPIPPTRDTFSPSTVPGTNSSLNRAPQPTDPSGRPTMAPIPLRTQLLIATVLIIFALTGATLLIVRHTVSTEIQKQVRDGTRESARTFTSVQEQRESQLSR